MDAIRAITAIATVIDYGIAEIEAAALLADHHNLSPTDSIHATLAFSTDAIVSTDSSYDRIKGLKRIDFSE